MTSYRMLVLAAVALSATTARAQDRQLLPGWGPFKFGMSRDAIISDMDNRVTRVQVGPQLIYAADINATPYSASLAFDDNLRLSEIRIEQQDAESLDENSCDARLDETEVLLRKRYGSPDVSKEARELMPEYKMQGIYKVSDWHFGDGAHLNLNMLISSNGMGHSKCMFNLNYIASANKPARL